MGETMKIDGRSAFPTPGMYLPSGEFQWPYEGMSLRDYFAGMAMQANLTADEDARNSPRKAAQWSYEQADAMLAERRRS